MKNNRYVVTVGVTLLFVISWAVCVSLVLSIQSKPPFVVGSNPALLRLYLDVVSLVAMIAVTVLFVRVSKHTVRVPISRHVWRDSIVGLLLGICWVLIVGGVFVATGALELSFRSIPSDLFVWMLALLLNAVAQELLVRGYMFSFIRHKFNVGVALVVTTLLFTALHGFEPGAYGLGMLNLAVASSIFTLLLMIFDGLLVPIIVHFIWNAVLGVVLGAVVLANGYPSLYTSILHGGVVIGGGATKIEGSVITLVLNIIILAVLVFVYRTSTHKPNDTHTPATV